MGKERRLLAEKPFKWFYKIENPLLADFLF